MEKEKKKGLKNAPVERTIFDDEEQRRCIVALSDLTSVIVICLF
jgi:hypothetical protein